MRIVIVLLFYSFSINYTTLATISPSKKGKHKETKYLSGPRNENVFDFDFVSPEPNAKDILMHNAAYYRDTSVRRFNGTVLGYVTPWNNHGYDVAKIFGKKFDIISPVWLQVVPNGETYELAGVHDIDRGWLNDVRRKSKRSDSRTVKILPRIILDHFGDKDITRLLSQETQRNKLYELLINSCREYGFNGFVLELWSQLAGRIDDQYLYAFVIQMAKELQKQQLRLVLVIPPLRKGIPDIFTEKHMDKFYKHIYAFSLMTYDYSSVQRPGANAPLYWMKNAVEALAPQNCHDMAVKRAKILMGLNMYGNDYTPDGGGPITYARYLELVKHVKKHLSFDERDVENFFEIKTANGRHIVFYPTLHSVNERIKLAQELGVGLSLWELGQGLDYFYDLF